MNVFSIVSQVIAIIIALVNIVERPGDGAQKRKEVIDLFIAKANEFLELPKWAADLFLRDSFVGWIVDVVVWAANTFGIFEHSGKSGTTPGDSSNEVYTVSV